MFRVSRGMAAGILAGAALLRSAGGADATTTTTVKSTTTTTSTSTTSTTLQPHPFSKATAQCIHMARVDFNCHKGVTCSGAFQAAYANCFAPKTGVTCANKCLSAVTKCQAAVPANNKSCLKACRKAHNADVAACQLIPIGDNVWAGGDAGCLTTAAQNFALCKFTCSEGHLDCQTNFQFCIADCPNM